jgi:hypothetical protein
LFSESSLISVEAERCDLAMVSWRPFKMLICFFIGHNDSPVVMKLGKLVTQEVEARKCSRCGRILVPLPKNYAAMAGDAM